MVVFPAVVVMVGFIPKDTVLVGVVVAAKLNAEKPPVDDVVTGVIDAGAGAGAVAAAVVVVVGGLKLKLKLGDAEVVAVVVVDVTEVPLNPGKLNPPLEVVVAIGVVKVNWGVELELEVVVVEASEEKLKLPEIIILLKKNYI